MDKESCLDVPNLGGVSNLVRKWKDFENSEFVGSPQKGFDECNESCCSIVKSESFGDLESDKIEISKDCDVKESERLGVADIIKKFTFDNGNVVVVANGGSLPRVRTSMMDHSEGQRPRELEGLVERKAVSKFQQRGHIQVVLRVRLIRRGAEVRGGRSLNCPASESNKSTNSAIMQLRAEASLPHQIDNEKRNFYREFKGLTSPQRELARSNSARAGTGFSLYQQREEDPLKGPGVADSRSTSITLGDNTRDPCIFKKENHHKPRSSHKEVIDNNPKAGNIDISNKLQEENHHEEVSEQVSLRKVATSIQVGNRFSSHQQREGDQPGESDSRSSPRASGEKTRYPKEENHHKPRNIHKEVVDNIPKIGTFCISNQPREENHYEELCKKLSSRNLSKNQKEMACSTKKSEGSCRLNQHCMDLNYQEVSTSLPSFTYQAQSLDNTSSEASHSNLLDNISRPRKEWEGLRQERYQDMLDPYSDNHDIQLLHRKSVSSFLTSGLREQIDRIMASRSQQLPNAKISHVEEEVPAQAAEDEEEEEVEQNAKEEEDEVGEEEEWGFDNDSEDDNSSSRQHYNEPEVLIHQNTSSQTLQSWSTNQDQETTDDSYHFPSPSSLLSQSSNIPSGSHPSTEMKLIYEMRGHMEQLRQEIFEIRRSMKSCMNMQMKLQRSIKQDVAAAISQLGQKSRGNSDKKGSNKGNCCICCEEPVDSLLYRCGHMCTCFKCAHKLISGSGICPICQAPIMGVVRAHAHS
ncbi:hypothetical protein K7X08_016584 [Anisodus acutangulus]|uniref:RING-type domain-containing protein n=1 Tax=Anisodus acutangulus TaxID=402998 RepID=A0A9Q1R063_9SOLA|nr:hypothetical protein K7X08_016584 [Anisodus acutangulus]